MAPATHKTLLDLFCKAVLVLLIFPTFLEQALHGNECSNMAAWIHHLRLHVATPTPVGGFACTTHDIQIVAETHLLHVVQHVFH